MGIDFSHGNAHWSYSGFNRFRMRLASEIGISLDDMEGYGGEYKWEIISDPIKPLLTHSDCDGLLSPDVLFNVAQRLREIVSSWDDEDYDKFQAIELAEGMELAYHLKEDLIFT